MILIFGGSYNGKINYTKKKYEITENDIFYCKDTNIDFSKKVICGIHIFVKKCVVNDLDTLEILKENIDNLKDKIIITDEIGSGIVPIKKEDRLWRETLGKSIQFLAENSNEVYRIFFGLEECLKKV